MREFEFRILGIHSGHLVGEPLDGAGVSNVWVTRASRFIENEVVTVRAIQAKKDGLKAEVVSARRDPSFLKVRPLALVQGAEDEYEFEDYPALEDADEFEDALELYRAGCHDDAARALRCFLARFPLHIDAYHHLGNIEWKQGRFARAQKYYEMGHSIGLLSLPYDFRGRLPWSRGGNRPFLRATHAYALLLSRTKRTFEACKICEQILEWDPGDHLGIRDLLPRYYFEARAPALAHDFLRVWGADGMNGYTLGLLKLMEGRRREALRCLCAAVTYNPYVPLFLVGERRMPSVTSDTDYVTMGGELEAAEYLHEFARYWRRDRFVDFLRRLMKTGSPFRKRFDRFLAIKEQLDEIRDYPVRERLLAEKRRILNDDDVRALLREAADTMFT